MNHFLYFSLSQHIICIRTLPSPAEKYSATFMHSCSLHGLLEIITHYQALCVSLFSQQNAAVHLYNGLTVTTPLPAIPCVRAQLIW